MIATQQMKTAAPDEGSRRFHLAAKGGGVVGLASGSQFTPCKAETREAEAEQGQRARFG